MKRRLLAGVIYLLALCAPSVSAAAGKPSWDFIALSVNASGELKQGSNEDDLIGHQLEASKSLGDVVFFRAVANAQTVDFTPIEVDLSTQQFGLGGRLGVAPGTDLWASVNYERISLGGIVGVGMGIDLGARSQVMEKLALGLTVKTSGDIDFGDAGKGDYTGYEFFAAYAVVPSASFLISFGDYRLEADPGVELNFDNVVKLGIRLGF